MNSICNLVGDVARADREPGAEGLDLDITSREESELWAELDELMRKIKTVRICHPSILYSSYAPCSIKDYARFCAREKGRVPPRRFAPNAALRNIVSSNILSRTQS